ncbi:uncharacterized protein RCC_12278 [Ramularia collo-cygni]|uniref:RING-type domain-containing protein n=1 Tax=Ramularia collo-cygni TaxID=112498 RepID=A0A2D3UNI7_9PEZI|nr:uncharacterized protein RCC_12278 [Ramularia collo-cygni]CZT15008.1 uncharacterized protein RCC_12278 [Ramularia collo-cygni]
MMQEERSAKSELPSFWVPGETPSNQRKSEGKVGKVHPTCPAAENSKPHDFALRSLITVRFTEERQTSSSKESGTGEGATEDEKWEMKRMCPACHKVLSNSTKAILAKPCGHVLCKPCSARFQKVEGKSAHDVVVVGEGDGEDEQAGVVRCYVCQENVTAGWKGKGKKEKRKRDLEKKEKIVERGLVELSCEGTGFAGGGRNVVKKDGLSFQC